jgi:hypothetical protein
MRIKRIVAATFTVFISLAIIIPITNTRARPPVPAVLPNAVSAETCAQILTRAVESLQSTCNDLSRNNACYGNNQVKAEPNSGATLKFDAIGDREPIRNIRTLVTSPLNVDTGTWGLSLLKLQANLPDTLPGQNVTFLVFGDTSLENLSGDMQSFYFTSGLGNLSCKEAPRDGIVVRSPQHTEVTFTANGVKITIASTIVLRAERNKSMSVELVEGHAQLTTTAGSQTLQPGEISTVTLGGTNGLTATDAPSVPATAQSNAALAPIFVTTGQVADPDAAVNVTINGCISDVRGDSVTVNDYQINVGSDKTLKDAKAGDCVHIDGTLKTDPSKKITLNVIKAEPREKAKVNPDGGPNDPEAPGDDKNKDQGKGKPNAKPDEHKPGGAKPVHESKVSDIDKDKGKPKPNAKPDKHEPGGAKPVHESKVSDIDKDKGKPKPK